jgi:hypothetical protein
MIQLDQYRPPFIINNYLHINNVLNLIILLTGNLLLGITCHCTILSVIMTGHARTYAIAAFDSINTAVDPTILSSFGGKSSHHYVVCRLSKYY